MATMMRITVPPVGAVLAATLRFSRPRGYHPAAARCQEKPTSPAPFPDRIAALPPFAGPFDAHRLAAEGCDVLFASYPAGTVIADHDHETDNVGVITRGALVLVIDGTETRFGPGEWYQVARGQVHGARFEADTAEIEFWFRAGDEPGTGSATGASGRPRR